MPSEGRRLHGFTVVSKALELGRQLVFPALLGGASVGDGVTGTLQWIALMLTIPSLLIATAGWLMFRYRLEGEELIIDSGVFSRRRRVIPLARIQNIDLKQSAVERLAGVATIQLETASGGSETEASLAVLSHAEARDLQTELMRRRAEARASRTAPSADQADPDEPTTAPQPTPRRLLRLSITDLAIAGATSNEAGLIAAGLATGLQVIGDVGGALLVDRWLEAAFGQGAALGVVGAIAIGAVLSLAFVLTGWVLSVFVTVVRYHGFTLTRVGDDVRREFGLLSRHHSTIPLERIQAVRIEESILRRVFGLVALKIETAGAGPQRHGSGAGESEAFVPIARKHQVGPLLREVFPAARFENVELHPVSPLAMRRTFARLAVPTLIATAAATALLGPRWLALLALLIPAGLYARADYRARAWGRPAGHTLVRGGVMTRVTWVVPDEKIQTLHLHDTPFQRRLGLRSLLVDTAAGGRVASVRDLERRTADELLHGLAIAAEAARRRAGLRATAHSTPEPALDPGW